MSNGMHLILILAWAFGGPGTAIYWLGLKYGYIGGIVWLVGLVFLARWRMPSDLEDTTN